MTPEDQQLIQKAIQLQTNGRPNEAESIYTRILNENPDHPDALHLLGTLVFQLGQRARGIELMQSSLRKNDRVDFRTNLAGALKAEHRFDEALECFLTAANLQDSPELQDEIGCLQLMTGRTSHAEKTFEALTKSAPTYAPAWSGLGRCLTKSGQFSQAESAFSRSLEIAPSVVQTRIDHAILQTLSGRLEEACAALEGLIRDAPQPTSHLFYLVGKTYTAMGRYNDAESAFRNAISLTPEHAEAHAHLGMLLLLQGRHAEGWDEYEWRVRAPGFPLPPTTLPLWDGRDLDGDTLVLRAEQGYGDTLHFIRLAKSVADRNATVIVSAPPPLHTLLRSVPGVSAVCDYGVEPPHAVCQAPLLSLPRILRDAPPTVVPYLHVPDDRHAKWHERLSQLPHPKVGLVWQGGDLHPNDVNRSASFDDFSTLLESHPSVSFVTLQMGANDADTVSALGLSNWLDDIQDFADTAAIVSELDLVISVDTAVCHLAGGLGRPVWTLLAKAPDFRWGSSGSTTDWYPSMRLFRQSHWGDWSTVIGAVSKELAQIVARGVEDS